MDQSCANFYSFLGKHCRGFRIDNPGRSCVLFRVVYSGIGCGVDNPLGLEFLDCSPDIVELPQIKLLAIKSYDFTQAGQ